MSAKALKIILFVVIAVVLFLTWGGLTETVDRGEFHIIQYPVTGTMKAKMKTGMYLKLFGKVEVWPVSETFYFTADKGEGARRDESIEVRFVDGSEANISGTCRVVLPKDSQEAIGLMVTHGFQSYEDLQHKLVLPTVRNALRQTANMMTARESYAEKRTQFIEWSRDQVDNGLFETVTEERTVEDPITGQKVNRQIKVTRTDENGHPIRVMSPLAGTGISLSNFDIKKFNYMGKVEGQISAQQEARMAIATAMAQAEKAAQDAKTQEAKGKAEVMKVRYEQLKEKESAVIQAEKEKEVAELKAMKELEVAKLERQAAAETKQKEILLGQGEAERKKLVLAADGALQQKLNAYENISSIWAKAYSQRQVPTYYISGGGDANGGSTDVQTQQFMNLINAMMAEKLGLDLTVPKK